MTQDEIIDMAKAAHRELVTEYYVGHHGQIDAWTMLLMERFAKLVAAKERDHIAKYFEKETTHLFEVDGLWIGKTIRRIRARGEA